jgi:hypothetical protein
VVCRIIELVIRQFGPQFVHALLDFRGLENGKDEARDGSTTATRSTRNGVVHSMQRELCQFCSYLIESKGEGDACTVDDASTSMETIVLLMGMAGATSGFEFGAAGVV